jgi:hypothetical protein
MMARKLKELLNKNYLRSLFVQILFSVGFEEDNDKVSVVLFKLIDNIVL